MRTICLFAGGFISLLCSSRLSAQSADSSSDNVRIIRYETRYGLANKQGKRLTTTLFDTIQPFHDGVAVVGVGKREVNQYGKVLSDFTYGYLTAAGRLIVAPTHKYVNDFSEGLGLTGAGPYTFYTRTGAVAFRLTNYLTTTFQGNMAYVQVKDKGFWLPPYDDGRDNHGRTQLYDVDGNSVYGNYVDRSGNLLIPARYDSIAAFTPGSLRLVKKNGQWGFLDSLANVAVPVQYDDVDIDSTFFWRNFRRVGRAGRFGFMDARTGKLTVPLLYEATYPSQTRFVWVRKKSKWGALNTAGLVIIPFRYEQIVPAGKDITFVLTKKQWALVDSTGSLLSSQQYDEVSPFVEHRALVRRSGRLGYLDETGHEVIPVVYEKASLFAHGQAYVTRWGLFITINPGGDWVSVQLTSTTFTVLIVVIFLCVLLTGWLLYRARRLDQLPRRFSS